MSANRQISFEGVQGYLNNLFGDCLDGKRILSLASATLGAIHFASLAVALIGQGLALAWGLTTRHAVRQVNRCGRATPLCWLAAVANTLKGRRNQYKYHVLVRFVAALPEGTEVTIVADRGICDHKLVRALREELKFDFGASGSRRDPAGLPHVWGAGCGGLPRTCGVRWGAVSVRSRSRTCRPR